MSDPARDVRGVSWSAPDPVSWLASVFVNLSDAVVISAAANGGSEPIVVYVNPAFTRMTGYTPAEVINAPPRHLAGAGASPSTRAKIREAAAQRRAVVLKLPSYRKDASESLAEMSLTPLIDDRGTCTHWVAIERSCPVPPPGAAEALLAFRTEHDDLTGLYNRGYFIRCVEAAIGRARADASVAFSVVVVDLDRFKTVNERLGHRMGDRILRDLARRLEPLAGSRDTLARIGGDEFGLLIDRPDDPDEAVHLAKRLLAQIANRPRFCAEDVAVTASIGIVHWAPGMHDAEAMMRSADIAAGRSGPAAGGACAVFTPEMYAKADDAQRMRDDLAGAVGRAELRLHYQPLVDISTGTIYGFEGLVRWQHPVRGMMPPDEFIPAAEETGSIVELGRWVLLEGCRAACELSRIAERPLIMSLNVSSQQLLHPEFPRHLQEALDGSGIDARTLQLEITESVFLGGGTVVGALFGWIRALGIQIAFDDFGTGYSSLSYLERFQIDTLKIDKSFVARIDDASGKSEILRMIIALAHALGVDIVAEGVESRAQRDALGRLGCTHLQGFLFSPPVSLAQSSELLRAASDDTMLATLLRETLTDGGAAALSAAARSELREQVEAAIVTHHIWLDRLRLAVASGEAPFDVAQVAREDLCPIGIWLTTTISETLRTMPLYYVTKSRHAVFHRCMARLVAAAVAGDPQAGRSLRPDGDLTKVAASLLRTFHDWLAVANAGSARPAATTGSAPPVALCGAP